MAKVERVEWICAGLIALAVAIVMVTSTLLIYEWRSGEAVRDDELPVCICEQDLVMNGLDYSDIEGLR